MTGRVLTQLLPRLPPALDGVGDYTERLAEHWPRSGTAAPWQYLVRRDADHARTTHPAAVIEEMVPRAGALANQLGQLRTATAVVQYVGYGYEPRGIPLWLPQALIRWKRGGSDRRVAVMFHELYASGTWRGSAFWLMPLARHIIRQLLRVSSVWMTSCAAHEEKLLRSLGADNTRGAVIPIGSNIPLSSTAALDRPWQTSAGKLRVVVFGLAFTRLWILRHHRRLLRQLVQEGRVESITLVGQRLDDAAQLVELQALREEIGQPSVWREETNLSAAQISAVLAGQDLGLIANEPDMLTKSGVFAAYTGHGILTVVADQLGRPLPAIWRDAVLLNADTEASVQALSRSLNNPSEIASRRAQVRVLGESEISWPRIAERWQAHLDTEGLL